MPDRRSTSPFIESDECARRADTSEAALLDAPAGLAAFFASPSGFIRRRTPSAASPWAHWVE
jgi:hypothetical protein